MFSKDRRLISIFAAGMVLVAAMGCGPVRTSAQVSAAKTSLVQKTFEAGQACPTLHCVTAPDNKKFYANVSPKAFEHAKRAQ